MAAVRVCFLGTPEFAAQHLSTLMADESYEVVGVVTQPDRPAGRKMQLAPSAVKRLALGYGLPVLTPENLRKDGDALSKIQSWRADVAVVVAYGQILSRDFLKSFPYGAVNVHGSLLPLWRGAAPIQRSLEAGDTLTGVSLQKMVYQLDAGPVIGERKIALDDRIDATVLYSRLAQLGCELLKHELMDYLRGDLVPVEQDETKVTLAAKIEKDEALLTLGLSGLGAHNKVRAFSMGPGTYFISHGKRLKVHETYYLLENSGYAPGQVADVTPEGLSIQMATGQLILKQVQPESKSRMPILSYLSSMPLKKGDSFVASE